MASAGAVVADQGRPSLVPAVGGSYVEGVVGGYRHLDPLLAVTPVDHDIAHLVFSGLTRTDRNGNVVPDLASKVDVGEQGKVWTFTIRDDARWQDGQPVVADDVVYTVGLLKDPAYSGPYKEAFHDVTVTRVGERVVRFTLPDVYGPFEASTTFPLLPSHLLSRVPFSRLADDAFDRHPVGTGPFSFSTATAGEIALVANTDFYRTRPQRSRPYLDRFILRSFGSASDALAALARGEIDGVAGISSQDAERARSVPTLNVYSYPTNDFTALFLNVRPSKAVFRDPAVRRAIAYAIDRGKVLDLAIEGRGRVADTFVPPTSWAYPTDITKYDHSPTEAKALLDGAGWVDDGSGVREKDGVTLSFTLSTSDEPARTAAAREIADDLAEVGIQVKLSFMPFDQLVQSVVRPRAFDALLVGITASADPDPYPFFHSSQVNDPGDNFSGFSTLPIDRDLEAARRTNDHAERQKLYEPVFQAIATEVPVVFLYFSDDLYVQRTGVAGLKIAQITEPAQRFWNVEDWSVRTIPRR
ncbi:MAG: peptide ABC transporter substrate-binding protein [Chloroflexota bacterium]|nr:peptide ABC transporter substrate-binding protein [Chloroflexota bacterium]MDE3102196.1 peptide ABC transporter substrate-binding protein [Chloroflexota bacterium]